MTSPTPPRRPRWGLLAALLVGVTAIVAAVAAWQPFAPSASGGVDPVAGDPARGATLFAASCAGCHGEAGVGGGVGPALAGRGLTAAAVAGVVAAGQGVMPAGILTGQDAADVAAYVAGGGGPGTGTGASTAPAPPATPAPGGLVAFPGPVFQGVKVDLDAPAPAAWRVWLEGPRGRLEVARIDAGEGSVLVRDLGRGTLPSSPGRVLVGADPARPALAAEITAEQAEAARSLVGRSEPAPGNAPLIGATAGRVDLLREHIRFLVQARDEGNLPNVRFHGEHLVNIVYGGDGEDLDGNGEASNPGDGVGILGPEGPPGYLGLIARAGGAFPAGGGQAAALIDVADRAGRIAGDGALCARAGSVEEAVPAIARIVRADAALARAWTEARARLRFAATLRLEEPRP